MFPNSRIEVWRAIKDAPDYQVSSLGRIKRCTPRPKCNGHLKSEFLKTYVCKKGYAHASVRVNGTWKTSQIHRLVAIAFIGGSAPGTHVNHIDGNKLNNCVENLEHVSPKDNQLHASRLGLLASGQRNGNSKLANEQVVEIKKRIADGQKNREIAEAFGVHVTLVHLIRHKKIWTSVMASIFLFFPCGVSSASDVDPYVIQTIAYEARGESLEGQIAVAEVIRQRARKGRLSPLNVVKKPFQFSCNNPGVRSRLLNITGSDFQRAAKAWELSETSNLTRQASHYYNPSLCSPNWASKLRETVRIGQHRFMK